MSSTLRQIKVIIYRLKRQYGVSASFSRIDSSITDTQTGVVTRVYSVKTLGKFVLLPDEDTLLTNYSGPFYQAGREFTYGAAFEEGQRFAIVDNADLGDWLITQDQYVTTYILGGQVRYKVKKIVQVAEGYATMLALVRIEPSQV